MVGLSVSDAADEALEGGLVGDNVAGLHLHHEPGSTETERALSRQDVDATVGSRRRDAGLISLRSQDCGDQLREGMTGEVSRDVPFDLVARQVGEIDHLVGFDGLWAGGSLRGGGR